MRRVDFKQALEGLHADTHSVRGGVHTLRWGFFYTHGRTEDMYAARVTQVLPTATIVDFGKVDKPFNGGGTTAQNSHFFVKFTIELTP